MVHIQIVRVRFVFLFYVQRVAAVGVQFKIEPVSARSCYLDVLALFYEVEVLLGIIVAPIVRAFPHLDFLVLFEERGIHILRDYVLRKVARFIFRELVIVRPFPLMLRVEQVERVFVHRYFWFIVTTEMYSQPDAQTDYSDADEY